MAVGGDKLSIERITTEDLRRMEGQEVLILQGCDGDLEEWMEGINEMLTQSGILLEQNLNKAGRRSFRHENCR